MARPPTENPYHHPFVKPLAFDSDAITSMCREGFEVAMATRGLETLWNGDLNDFGEDPAWSHPLLVQLHQDSTEERLSAILLTISVFYRALDDQLKDDAGFAVFKKEQLAIHNAFATSYGDDEVQPTLRECCNKIIHTNDFRPVYDNGSQPQDEGVFYMTGEIELEGKIGNKTWNIVFDVFSYFEAMLETVEFLSEEQADSNPKQAASSDK